MRPRLSVAFLGLLALLVLGSEAKLRQLQQQHQAVVGGNGDNDDDDEDDDEDDWDDDGGGGSDGNYPSRPEIDDDGSRVYKNPRNSPSAHCPRDEEQADVLGQKCLRKCSSDEDCKSKKKKCRCDGVCGMSCIKPDRECPELVEIEHGLMTLSGRLFGDRANYTCDPGYLAVGLEERVCRADGRWNGVTPACKKDPSSFCQVPNKLPNARHNALPEQTTFDLDSVVQYFCNHGYETRGSPKAKCLMAEGAASWYGPDITCEAISCGPPADIANGWHAGECYKYDCHVSYHCADGYELVGKADKVCVADGTWLPAEIPKCVEVTSVECDPPSNPINGKAIYTSVAYNSVVSYECKTGYTIVGAATRRCGADGKWTGQTPTCREINCGSPGILYNGWIDNIENGTGMGASLIFRCKDHMKLEGHSSSLCQMDGQWRYPLPHCLAPCVVPHIARGHVYVASTDERDHINNVTVAEHGKRLAVECVSDYEFAPGSAPVVCNNGTWSAVPACTPARCKQMPKPPKNGIVIAPKTDHGMRAVFKCKDGFELVGGGPYNNSYSVECQYGNWTGDVPHCIEVYCPFPGYIQNGKVLLVGNMGVYDYRPYVRKIVNNKQIMYDCDKGYYLSEGPPGATCIGGSWSPKELPKCSLGQHPRIRWNRRRRSVGHHQDTKNETVVMAYKKFVDFFRKVGKKLLELEMEKSHEAMIRVDGAENLTSSGDGNASNATYDTSVRGHGSRANGRPRTRDEKMIDFLRIVYRKLQRIDARHASNDTNVTMHELLNAMSKNFFHVDLAEQQRRNASGRGHEGAESRSQREFTKLKREFERIMKFYNKSLRWSEKHLRKDLRKRKNKGQASAHGEREKHASRAKENKENKEANKKQQQQQHKSPNYYKGFYEFINDYVSQKLSALEAQNATEELIQKMRIDKITVRNGTMFTVGEIYAFFKHIIEAKLNASRATANNETLAPVDAGQSPTKQPHVTLATPTSNPSSASKTSPGLATRRTSAMSTTTTTTKTTASTKSNNLTLSENEIPALDAENVQPRSRNKRIRDASTLSPITEVRRKLLSVNHPLGGDAGASLTRARRFALAESSSFAKYLQQQQQLNRAKRYLPSPSESQTFLKNLYLNAYEERYNADVKRSASRSERSATAVIGSSTKTTSSGRHQRRGATMLLGEVK